MNPETGQLYASLQAAREAGAADPVEVRGTEAAIVETSARIRHRTFPEELTEADRPELARAQARRELRAAKRLQLAGR